MTASPSPPLDAVIGVGSNLGDRHAHIERACEHVAMIATIVARSKVRETAPVGPPQPHYLNGAIRVTCALTPEELLAELLRIEDEDGRNRAAEVRFGPRTIDLDILWIRDRVVSTDLLVVPHPRLHQRAFALIPLYEVAPEATDPTTGLKWSIPAAE